MINLQDYGELSMKQEFFINNNKIVNALYIGHNEMYDVSSFITIEIDKLEYGYKCTVNSNNKSKNEFKVNNIYTVNKLLSIADHDIDVPVKIYSYDNSEKTEDDTFLVELNNISLEIDKNKKLVIDGKYYANEVIDNLVYQTHYEFQDYGIYCNDSNKEITYLLNGQNTSTYGIDCIELTKIRKNIDKCTVIPNLQDNVGRVIFYNDREIVYSDDLTYDNFGIVKSGDNMLYEAYTTDEFDTPIFISSLHPFYYDNFDTNLIGINKYCIDQINRVFDSDDEIYIYTREVYDIDNEHLKKLLEEINKAKESKEPSIEILN